MPWLPIPEDHCRTAADVREQIRHVAALKQQRRKREEANAKPAASEPAPKRVLSPEEQKIELVIEFVCSHFCISRKAIGAAGNALNARHVLSYMLHSITHMSWVRLGEILNRNDTVVISSYRRVENLLRSDPEHLICSAVRAAQKQFGEPKPVAPPSAEPAPVPVPAPKQEKIHDILNLTGKYFSLDPEIIKSPRRTSYVVDARHIAMFLCTTCTSRNVNEISRYLNRDHTSVLHGCRQVVAQMNTGNAQTIADVNHLRAALKGAPLVPRAAPALISENRYNSTFAMEDIHEMMKMFAAGVGYDEIGLKLNRSAAAVKSKLRRIRIDEGALTRSFAPFTEEEEKQISELYLSGMTNKKISEMISRSPDAIRRKVQRMGIQREPVRKPQRIHCSIVDRSRGVPFTPEELSKIRNLWLGGRTGPEIGRVIGRSRSSVRDRVRELEQEFKHSETNSIRNSIMSGSVNKVILVGNLGADPEIRRTNDGRPIANLRLATTESWRDKNSGDRREKTEWHRVVIFNENLTKIAEQYLRKGSKVYLEGQLQTRKWQDQQGQDRYTTEVVLQGFNAMLALLDRRQDNGQETQSAQQPAGQPLRDEMNDEVPF